MDLKEIREALVGKVIEGQYDDMKATNRIIGEIYDEGHCIFNILDDELTTIFLLHDKEVEDIISNGFFENGINRKVWLKDPQQKPEQTDSDSPINWEKRTWDLAVKLYTYSENTDAEQAVRYAKDLVEEYRREFKL